PMPLPDQADLNPAIAVTRFGLGARPGEIEAARADPQGFLKAQIRPQGADQPEGDLKSSGENLKVFYALRGFRKPAKAEDAAAMLTQVQGQIRYLAINEMAARGRLASMPQ